MTTAPMSAKAAQKPGARDLAADLRTDQRFERLRALPEFRAVLMGE